jgi:3-hydroxyisobutyrate dehydrogenase-like beta-hydroxyacid dehydrogenase
VKKIVVIGTGRMGGAFATAFAKRTSHAVLIRGSHAGSSSAAALSRQLGVRVADDKELLAADVVFVGLQVDFDVMVEVAFADEDAFLAYMGKLFGPEAVDDAVAVDEAKFLDRSRTRAYVVDEHVTAG